MAGEPEKGESSPAIRRVLFVIGSLAVGGAEMQLASLASGLVVRNHAVRVFAIEGGGPVAVRLRADGCEVIDGGYTAARALPTKLLRIGRALWRLWIVALLWRPHVMHAFLPLAGLLAVVAGKLAGIRCIVVSRRALGTHQDRHPYWRRVDRVVAALAHCVTANSHAVARDAAARDGVALERIAVIPNGIDVMRYKPDPERRAAFRIRLGLRDDEIAIVCVANMILYKGHLDLIRAFAHVRRAVTNTTLFLVGEDRGMRPQVIEQAIRLHVANAVSILGHRDDVPALLSAMDIGVLASHEEGMSNALLEYLASGLVVVATDVGGNHELLHGVPGCRLVPPRSDIALAAAITAVIREGTDSGATERIRLTAQRYSNDAMVLKHIELYEMNLKKAR